MDCRRTSATRSPRSFDGEGAEKLTYTNIIDLFLIGRRAIAVGVVLVAMTTTGVASAAAETPPGPRLGYQHFESYPDVFLTIDPSGGDVQSVVNFARAPLPMPAPGAGLTWSPDGTSFAYAGVVPGGGIGAKPRQRRIYLAPTSGAPAVEVPGSLGGQEPVFAPGGRSLAVLLVRHHGRPLRRTGARPEQSSIWLLSLDGRVQRQLTPWRGVYAETPWSFKPDGSALGIIRSVRFGPPSQHRGRGDAIALGLDGSGETRIAKNATGLAFSPDGARVALLRRGRTGDDLWVGAADGSDLRLISDGPRSEESPTWDPSGQRLAFVMAASPTYPQGFTFWGDSLLQVNADGSCQTELKSETTSFTILSPSWQPGPGRGAGLIAC